MDEAERSKYRRAIEKALAEIPVENGSIHINSIWLETSLPKDLIAEIIKDKHNELKFPANVERIVMEDGTVCQLTSSQVGNQGIEL